MLNSNYKCLNLSLFCSFLRDLDVFGSVILHDQKEIRVKQSLKSSCIGEINFSLPRNYNQLQYTFSVGWPAYSDD